MSVRIVFPKPKLAKQLRAIGGLAVEDALTEANANLETLKPECLDELRSLVEKIETAFKSAGDGGHAATDEIYGLASHGVGLGAVAGLPSMDDTLVSLCSLVDNLQVRKIWDREALAVHVQTLKLLVVGNLPPEAVQTLVNGLQRVNAHYKPAETEG